MWDMDLTAYSNKYQKLTKWEVWHPNDNVWWNGVSGIPVTVGGVSCGRRQRVTGDHTPFTLLYINCVTVRTVRQFIKIFGTGLYPSAHCFFFFFVSLAYLGTGSFCWSYLLNEYSYQSISVFVIQYLVIVNVN